MSNSTNAPARPSLRQKTVGGVMWLGLQNVSTRAVSILQQLALAWLLAKSDFGLIGLAYSVTAFINLLANPGIDAVLVQRGRRFDRWATPAFWLGMTTGLAGLLLMVAAAPVAAWAYGQPELTGLILVLSLGAPLQTLQIVPRARLQVQLRFKALAALNSSGVILTAALTVLSAYLGFGPYSFAIPVPISAAIVASVAWWLARPRTAWNPHVRRWKYLLGDSLTLAGAKVMHVAVGQGDYVALGLFGVPEAAIGTYYFAYRFATQGFWLIANSVPSVLFPSLSRLVADPALQVRATNRAARLLALVATPFCLLQILLAGPLFRLIFPPRWLDAVLPLQILCVGIMINAPAWPATSLMMAQRRFRELFRVSLLCAMAFVIMVVGALLIDRSITTVALAVSLWYLVSSPYAYWASMPERPSHALLIVCYRPLLAGAAAAIPCTLLLLAIPDGRVADALAIAGIMIGFSCIYLLALRWIAPEDWADLWTQLKPVWSRLSRRQVTAVEG